MNEKEKNAIEYLKTRLYGNECCKYIDIAKDDLRIFVNLIEKTEKNINSWKKYSDEQEENVIEKNNNICNLEFQIEKLQKEIEELKIAGIPVRNKRNGRIGIVLRQWKSGSVAVLESINPRVINTHDSWNTLEIVADEVKQTQTKCETVPVSLVKDKIEELKQADKDWTEELSEPDGNFKIINRNLKRIKNQIDVLRELIEESDKKIKRVEKSTRIERLL